MGRPLRLEPDNPDKIALIVQIKYPPKAGRVDYLAEMVFGFEQVMSGVVIGPERAGPEQGSTGKPSGGTPDNAPDNDFSGRLQDLPDDLREALQPLGRPLAEVLVASDDFNRHRYVRPEGYDTSVSDLLEHFPGIRREWFNEKLDGFKYLDPETGELATGIPYALIWAMSPERERSSERYYDSALVAAFLEKTDVPKIAGSETLSGDQLATRLGIPPSLVTVAARELKIVITEKSLIPGRHTRPSWRYSSEQIGQITDWVEALPVADDTKVWFSELSSAYGRFAHQYRDRRQMKTVQMRHPADSGMNGSGPYIDIDDAAAVRQEHARITGLMATTRAFQDIVRRTGMAKETLLRSMTPEERAAFDDTSNRFHEIGGSASKKPLRHLPISLADALEARLLGEHLSPHEVTRQQLAEWMGMSQGRVAQLLPTHQLGTKRLGPRNSQVAIYHISSLGLLADHYQKDGRGQGHVKDAGMLEQLATIDYSQLPALGEPSTEEQRAYARTVQLTILNISEESLRAAPQPETPPLPPPAAAESKSAGPAPAPVPGPGFAAQAAPDTAAKPEPPASPAPELAFVAPELDEPEPVEPEVVTPEPKATFEIPVLEPLPGSVGLDVIMDLTERSFRAVNNMVMQLGLSDYLRAGTLPPEHAELVISALSGGKKADGHQTATTAPAQQHADGVVQDIGPESAVRVSNTGAEKPTEDDPDPTHWRNVEDVMADLRCTPAALTYLVAGDRRSGPRIRRTDEGVSQIHTGLLERIRAATRRTSQSQTGWMSHARLAENVSIPSEELSAWMRDHRIAISQGEVQVARRSGQAAEFEVMYSERVWRKAMHAQPD
jgi:hypothetical protein